MLACIGPTYFSSVVAQEFRVHISSMVVAGHALARKSYYAETLKKTRRRLRMLLCARVAYITESAALSPGMAEKYERRIHRTEVSITAARRAITIQISMCVLSTLSKRFYNVVRGMR